jgi:hypothetical protein
MTSVYGVSFDQWGAGLPATGGGRQAYTISRVDVLQFATSFGQHFRIEIIVALPATAL